MLRHLQRILFALFAMQAWTRTRGQQSFPTMKEIFDEFYQTEVQLSDENQDGSSLATEYYDNTEARGRLDVLIFGNRKSFFYYNTTGDILEVNSTSCIVWPEEQSEYFYYEIFFGWLHKKPLVIGPSALLWFAQEYTTDYVDQQMVRGINCDHFQLSVDGKNEKVTYDYYFAAKDWTTPYQIPGKKVPIRITVNGESSRDSSKPDQVGPVNQVVDFSYFRPTIEDGKMQPDVGLGCFGRTTDLELPSVPKEFKFAAEVYDLKKIEVTDETDAQFERVWFSSYNRLGRLDIYKKDSMRSSIYDFNGGVTYSIENDDVCVIKPLRKSIFRRDENLLGRIKTPAQVLNLDGDFYFMGFRTVRGINCRVFESAKRRTVFLDTYYYLLVTTVYLTEPYTEVVVQGEDTVNVPVQLLISGYDKPNNLATRIQYNILGFDDVVGPTIFNGFPIQDCFPLANQRSYFVLLSPVDKKVAATLEMNNMLVVDQVKSAIMNATNISAVRLPFMKVDYESTGVYVTGLMLDRPPLLNQFWRQFYGPSRADGLKEIEGTVTKEKCAFLCVDESSFICRGFHFCNGLCYLNRKSIYDEKIEADTKELGVCEVFLRAEMNSTTKEPYLPDALRILGNITLTVDIPLPDETIQIKFPDVMIGEGPFEKDASQKSYNVIFYGFQLPAAESISTTVEKADIDTENDCYRACKEETSIDCQSFSYCPDATNGQCRVSSVIIAKDAPDSLTNMENNKLCNVYSLLNIDYFTPYPGKVLMVSGEKSFTKLSAEECALKCRMEHGDKFTCRGFEYCKKQSTCVLHSKHVLDVIPGHIASTKDKCTHYAAKFSADYLDMGNTIIDDNNNQRTDLSLEECARVCSEGTSNCRSFVFCPPSNDYDRDSSCSLTSLTLKSRNVKLTSKGKCRLYTKRDHIESYGLGKDITPTVYSKGSFTGVVIGMLVFGLFVGIAVFFGYSYYRSRRYNDGMSVRFMKQTNS